MSETPNVADGAANYSSPVVLKPRKAQPFFGRHPWVRAGGVDTVAPHLKDGDEVQLLSDRGRFIAHGLLNSQSHLRVRLYSWDESRPLNRNFWSERIARAIDLRKQLGLFTADGGCRLIYSEADGLSGLIVEYYAGHLVMQVTSLAILNRVDMLAEILQQQLEPQSISLRGEAGMVKAEGIQIDPRILHGELPAEPIILRENDLEYEVQLEVGQKTGFYLDQRDNRLAAAKYMNGRRVLDMFCYSGGFGLNAMRHGQAQSVLGVDGSGPAIEAARSNAARNNLLAQYAKSDCFDYLKQQVDADARYDAVILDPPKFTKTKRNIDEALKAYFHINRHAAQLLNPGGILVTCSCSGNVSREEFQMMLLAVAQKTGRDIRILESRGAAPDHPVGVTCMENDYLKCFICQVV